MNNWEPMKHKCQTPKVGVAAIVKNSQGKFLLGKRKNSHQSEVWAFAGGHVELGETFAEAAIRELKEEFGLCVQNLNNVKLIDVKDDIFVDEGLHYITIYVLIDELFHIEPTIKDTSFSEIDWFDKDNLPKNVWNCIDEVLTNV